MNRKLTWADIYKDFRQRLPTLSKSAVDYRPYDFMMIVVNLKDGSKVLYDAQQEQVRFLDRR